MALLRIAERLVLDDFIIWMTIILQSWQTIICMPRRRSETVGLPSVLARDILLLRSGVPGLMPGLGAIERLLSTLDPGAELDCIVRLVVLGLFGALPTEALSPETLPVSDTDPWG